MQRTKKNFLLKIALVFVLLIIVYFGVTLRTEQIIQNGFLQNRPSDTDTYIYDYAHILGDITESTHRFLKMIHTQYAIEALIVTVPSLPQSMTIESLAVDLFSNWKIGKSSGGRGILLLLADQEKQIKFEVGYELEDVFTDLFCGYIEDKQLKPYFLSNQLEIGLVALMEEVEKRAQIKYHADYTIADIEKLDGDYLSGGAGAKQHLSEYRKETVREAGHEYPAGKTPDEAWKTLIRSWEMRVRDPNLNVYTEITKLAYRDFQDLSDSRYEENVRTYKHKPYDVIQNEKYAVIYFGKKKGWENAPFLFCKTKAGWQFDIVHQRKYVRMGRSPYWGIERADYPYVTLLSKCPFWLNQDIPWDAKDKYRVEDDHRLAEEIRHAERALENNPEHFQTVIHLAKLYTVASLRPKKKIALLNKAKQLDPDSSEPFKYLGIVHLDAFYQFESAITEMETYVQRQPEDAFGRNYLGHLYYCTKRYKAGIDEFKTSVRLEPDNCYAFAKLSRCYAALYRSSPKIDPRRSGYRKKAIKMLENAAATATPDPKRITWLERYLFKNNILE